jgi:hypothetical protein
MVRLALLLLLPGCAYDWSIRSLDAAAETGAAPETSVADSFIADTAPSCDELLAKVVTARVAAKKCTSTAMVCMQEVTDECGCKSITAVVGAETNTYDNAVKAFKTAGCTSVACGACAMPLPGQCLPADAGGLACKGP